VRYTEALARFDAGKRKTAPTPPPDFDDEGSAFDPPRLGPTVFPNMKDRQNVTLGPRSGVMFIKLGD
jgi:hypothetical protein